MNIILVCKNVKCQIPGKELKSFLFTAGRREVERGKITLGDVLKFITGSEWEPVLGYTIQPKIVFEENEKGSLIPKSSTCINCLYLPVPGALDPWPRRSDIFELYDLAFCNTYFGLN